MSPPRNLGKHRLLIECPEEIPCNPCEEDCPHGAIAVGHPITNLPELAPERCNGCGVCIAACPAQAIFIVKESSTKDLALVGLPYEMLPSIEKGEEVRLLDLDGENIGLGLVERVVSPPAFAKTVVVYVRCSRDIADRVRAVRKV